MNVAIFEFFECAKRVLFYPLNDEASELCSLVRRKNFTEADILFYKRRGQPIIVRPRMSYLSDEIKELVEYEPIAK